MALWVGEYSSPCTSQEQSLQLVFLSIVDLKRKRSDVLLCGAAEKEVAKLAFPNGSYFCAVGPPANTPKAKGVRACIDKLKIDLEESAIDVGGITSRKKEFKPMMDSALQNWTVPPPVEVDNEDAVELHAVTSTSNQGFERDWAVVPAVVKLKRAVTAVRLINRMKKSVSGGNL